MSVRGHSYSAFYPLCLLAMVVFTPIAQAEIIDGFREMKFGMAEKEIVALEACSTSTECMYDLTGKNRYLTLGYSGTPGTGSVSTLSKITIDMGAFTDQWYEELQILLQDQYQLTNDLGEEDIAAFEKQHISELTSGYEQGQVLLTVVRRKFGNLILKVIYQNKSMATKFLQERNMH